MLTTERADNREIIESRLKRENIPYVINDVNKKNINVFFGNKDCIKVVSTFNKRLDKLTPEQDFMLGIMLGYDKIPEYWKKGLNGAHDKKFKYTQYSLNDLYNVSFRHALNMIKLNNGKIREKNVRILVQEPETVRFEQCFEGLKLVKREGCGKVFEDSLSFSFEGAGFVLRGVALKKDESKPDDTTRANLYIDGKFIEEASFPTSFHSRRHDLFWNYTLPEGKHKVDIKI